MRGYSSFSVSVVLFMKVVGVLLGEVAELSCPHAVLGGGAGACRLHGSPTVFGAGLLSVAAAVFAWRLVMHAAPLLLLDLQVCPRVVPLRCRRVSRVVWLRPWVIRKATLEAAPTRPVVVGRAALLILSAFVGPLPSAAVVAACSTSRLAAPVVVVEVNEVSIMVEVVAVRALATPAVSIIVAAASVVPATASVFVLNAPVVVLVLALLLVAGVGPGVARRHAAVLEAPPVVEAHVLGKLVPHVLVEHVALVAPLVLTLAEFVVASALHALNRGCLRGRVRPQFTSMVRMGVVLSIVVLRGRRTLLTAALFFALPRRRNHQI